MKYSTELDIDIAVACHYCGEALEVKRDKQHRNTLEIEVVPCPKCLEKAKGETP